MVKDYEQMDAWCDRKNEPKTNPIKANFQNAKMHINARIGTDFIVRRMPSKQKKTGEMNLMT